MAGTAAVEYNSHCDKIKSKKIMDYLSTIPELPQDEIPMHLKNFMAIISSGESVPTAKCEKKQKKVIDLNYPKKTTKEINMAGTKPFKTTEEIVEKLNILAGKTLEEISPIRAAEYASRPSNKRKQGVGIIIEEHLGLPANTRAEPDFGELGELKVIPMIQLKSDMKYMNPKERMVLSMINYPELIETDLCDTHFFDKIKKTIVVLYLHDREDNFKNNKILIAFVWEPHSEQLEPDFNIMKGKTLIGRISEGDCRILSSCPKHGGGWKKDNPELSSRGSRGSHPILGIVEKRGYCIKRDAIGKIITECTGIVPTKRSDWFSIDAFSVLV